MALERERGISITSTVLQFPYRGHTINLLDTPGHQDFGEDTYRTLLAADSAVMLIDAAKGVEPQTKKLFAICRERGIPLFTFMNKMDRPSRDPLELLDELESVLGIGAFPMNWPLGSGDEFRGVYDRQSRTVHLFERAAHGAKRAPVSVADPSDPQLRALVSEPVYEQFREGIELLDGAGERFDRDGDAARRGFAGLLRQRGHQLRRAALPGRVYRDGARRRHDAPAVEPTDEALQRFRLQNSGQHGSAPSRPHRVRARLLRRVRARHDGAQRAHRQGRAALARDEALRRRPRIARRRVCRRRRRPGQPRAPSPSATRSTKDGPSASPRFPPLPRNISRRCGVSTFRVTNRLERESRSCAKRAPCKSSIRGARREPNRFSGAVGELQFEVAKYRLESEYNVKTILHTLPYALARHVEGDRDANRSRAAAVERQAGRGLVGAGHVALFESEWSVRLAEEWNPQLRFVPFAAREDDEALAS